MSNVSNDIVITYDNELYDEVWEIPHKANTKYLSHSYFRYIGKFPPQIAKELLQRYGKPNMKILDPMCGGGTTLIEAKIAGYDAIGCDVNPVPMLISKVASTKLDPLKLEEYFNDLQSQIIERSEDSLFHNEGNKKSKCINLGDNEKFFTPDGLEKVSFLITWINSIDDQDLHDFFYLALLAVLRQISRANVKKMNVTIDESKKVKDVFETYLKHLTNMKNINEELQAEFKDSTIKIYKNDARKLEFEDSTFDMVVIHPPYVSNTAFSEATQLQLAIMGVKQKSIWKDELKARGSYSSVSDGLRKYLVGWHNILKEAYRVLKPGGICAIENGDGQIDFVRIPVGIITKEFAKDIGYSVEKHILHKINNNTGQTLTHKMKDQHIVIMRKDINE
ncbi:TRM11 family SAM-dependent methyltransferase [Bacillus cereus]|uniref:TRM11 family SAM-dependent methyltransferase n=1 Tax=Bacillus cereus TaxID=1396 RepID=UPI001386C893|nr:DNA methyltransferase [Bacillus cereus]